MNKRIILTVTTGRTGTGFLHKLGHCLSSVKCEHEPKPLMARRFRDVLYGKDDGISLWKEKLKIINNHNKQTYLETSHLVCKGFIEPLIQLDIVPDIIILTRNPREVATSFVRLNTIPGRTDLGRACCLQPDDPHIHLTLNRWDDLTDYQLCFWQYLEMEKRQQHYKKLINGLGGKVFETSVNQLKTKVHFLEWVKFMGEAPTVRLVNQYNNTKVQRVNRQQNRRTDNYTDVLLDEWEQEVRNRTSESN